MDEASTGALTGAASGAAAGAALGPYGMAAGAVIGGVVGASGGKGASKSRKAASRAALERQARAQENYQRTADIVNPASTQALMQFDKALEVQGRNIERQEKLVAQIDPTIVEASQQALRLLRGEESSALNPLRNSRNMQRQKLLNSLREQLGPGAETSSAGIMALNRFDEQTGNLYAGAQQNALSQMGNTAGQFNTVRPNMGNEALTFGNLASGRSNVAFNQANALSSAFSGVMGNAGASQVSDMMKGQYQQAQMNQLLQAGVTMGSAAMGRGGGGAAKPTPSAAPGPMAGGSYKDMAGMA
jgi:hypothetical protein